MSNVFFAEDDDIYGDFTSGSISLGDFKRQMEEGSVVVPTFQRNFVWTNPYKQRYLETLSKRGPIFGFVMNYNSQEGLYELIDGQNRGTTIYQFMNDEILFNKDPDEGGGIHYSDITGSEKRVFDRQEIHFIKTLNWSEDECQEYFRCIQDGMKLTKGEEIHSAQNNYYQQMIVYLANLFSEYIQRPKKDGGFNYVNKRYLHFEIIGGLLKAFMDEKYYDRPGQVALKELKKWDGFDPESNAEEDIAEKNKLVRAVNTFEGVMKFYIALRNGCENLNTMTYSRDSTFMRGMFFIFKNKIHLVQGQETPGPALIERFNEMMGIILKKNTSLYDQITIWGTSGEMGLIMDQYMRVFRDPTSEFVRP